MTSPDNFDRGGPWRLVFLTFLWSSVTALFALAMYASSNLFSFRDNADDPPSEFTEITGLTWPQDATIVAVYDTHGGFHGDGEFNLVFDTDRATLAAWLKQSPPWDQAEWLHGPPAPDIEALCCWDLSRSEQGADMRDQMFANDVWYVAHGRCCDSSPWENGEVLIVSLNTGRVWLSIWDY